MACFSRGVTMVPILSLIAVVSHESRCCILPSALGFSIMMPPAGRIPHQSRRYVTRLLSIADKTDPFDILNLSPNPDLDKKEIKRAYKRMALKFHPDVVTNQSSTPEERKRASDDFARINWAYETLSGKNQDATTATAAGGNSGYTPPHRRTGAYKSSTKRTTTSGASTNWEDYMPKYNDEDYDAGGDSFSAIFSDLLAGAAVGAAGVAGGGGGGVLRDLVDFLERNVEGYSGGAQDDTQLTLLLQTGSVEEIGMEMDDTELVVQQLSSKLENLKQEYLTVSEQAKQTARFLERLELEETAEELQARQKVSEGYLKKARTRLVKLQTRYKQLIVNGENDFGVASGSRRSSSSRGSNPTGSWTRETVRTDSRDETDDDEAWKRDGFGSSRRGSSRRRSARTRRAPESNQNDDFARQSSQQSQNRAESPRQETQRTTTRSSPSSPQSSPQSWTPPVPPHRRKSSPSQAQADKRRLRQLKVEDDFDQLKKDLGL